MVSLIVMETMVSFFIAGTPSNFRGFEMSLLGQQRKMKSRDVRDWSQFLDRFKPRSTKDQETVVRTATIQDKPYSLVVDYRAINPLEHSINRGAYICVGAICSSSLSLYQSIRVVEVVSEIHAYLQAMRNTDNAFDSSFNIDDVNYPNYSSTRLTAAIADSLCEKSNSHEGGPIIFRPDSIESDYREKHIDSKSFDEINKLKKENREYISQIDTLQSKLNIFKNRQSNLEQSRNQNPPDKSTCKKNNQLKSILLNLALIIGIIISFLLAIYYLWWTPSKMDDTISPSPQKNTSVVSPISKKIPVNEQKANFNHEWNKEKNTREVSPINKNIYK